MARRAGVPLLGASAFCRPKTSVSCPPPVTLQFNDGGYPTGRPSAAASRCEGVLGHVLGELIETFCRPLGASLRSLHYRGNVRAWQLHNHVLHPRVRSPCQLRFARSSAWVPAPCSNGTSRTIKSSSVGQVGTRPMTSTMYSFRSKLQRSPPRM